MVRSGIVIFAATVTVPPRIVIRMITMLAQQHIRNAVYGSNPRR